MTDTAEQASQHLWTGAGIIVVDKPRGPSSHQVAAWVGKMLGCQVGHSGTLDPQVSGVLLIMLGNAVRLAPLLLQHDKEYICLMRLHGDVDREQILKVAGEFTGRLYQRPPRKSAVKRNLRIREVRKLEILDIDGRLVLFKAECDAGTYIRSLCHHMGLVLGYRGPHDRTAPLPVRFIRRREHAYAPRCAGRVYCRKSRRSHEPDRNGSLGRWCSSRAPDGYRAGLRDGCDLPWGKTREYRHNQCYPV